MPRLGIAVLTAALVCGLWRGAAAEPTRLAIGSHRTICIDRDAAIPDAVHKTVAAFLTRQLAAATRDEAVVLNSAGCDRTRGDVVVRLSLARGVQPMLALTATDGSAIYRDEASRTGQQEADALALADRFFHSLKFDPHE